MIPDNNNTSRFFTGLWGIILGGSSGFGMASVIKLAKHGMNLVLVYRETALNEKDLQKKFAGLEKDYAIKILAFNTNALDGESQGLCIQKIREAVPVHSVKLLLHSIARGNLKPLIQRNNDKLQAIADENTSSTLSIEDIQLTTYAMATSLLDWTRSVLNINLFHIDARIIGLTSEGAHTYWEGYAAVSIAKASLESLATYMAVEFSKHGLKTNLIQAGITGTPSMMRIPKSEELLQFAKERNPMGRITRTEDVANVIYLLCTEEAFWINGSLIHVDGGEHCC